MLNSSTSCRPHRSLTLLFGLCLWLTAIAASGQSAPYAHTLPVTYTNPAVANLNGFATPNGLPTVAWFEWGTNSNFGNITSPTDIGSSDSVVWVDSTLEGLLPWEIYHFRLVASNAMGVAYGPERLLALSCRARYWGTDGFGQASILSQYSDFVSVDAGTGHSLALRRDGTVVAAGDDFFGKSTVPTNLTFVAAVSAGVNHSVALRSDGGVVQWGYAPPVPNTATNIVGIAAGNAFTIALKKDGTLVQWGGVAPPIGLSNVVEVSSSGYNVLVLLANGTVAQWGGSLILPQGLSNIVEVAAGYGMSVALKLDGTLIQWGGNQPGSALTNLIAVAAYGHGIALKQDCTVVQWGGITTPPPETMGKVAAVTAGLAFSIALEPSIAFPLVHTQPAYSVDSTTRMLNGAVTPNGLATVAWFECGTQGNYGNISEPIEVGGGTSIIRVSSSVSNLVGGEVYQFRLVASNMLGMAMGAPHLFSRHGHTVGEIRTLYVTAEFYPERNHDVAITAGSYHSLALDNEGNVNVMGQFYTGPYDSSLINAFVPEGLSNVVGIASGDSHCLAVNEDGAVVAWGGTRNYDGAASTNVPAGLSNVIAVAGGQQHSLALRGDGTVVAWGHNGSGQTNVPVDLRDVVAIAAGDHFSLALRNDGTIRAWGNNASGQLNLPVGLTNVTAFAAGGVHGLALKSDATVVAWGADSMDYGQTEVPTGLSNVVAIAAGRFHSLALKADGTLVTWGEGPYGLFDVASGVGQAVSMAGGQTFTMALSAQPTLPRAAVPMATHITSTSAWIGAFATPNAFDSVSWFEWGLRGSGYTNTTPVTGIGDGTAVVWCSVDLSGLISGATYHSRIVVSNEIGIAYGHPRAFTTGQRVSAWGYNAYGQTDVPAGVSNAVAVAAGDYHALALTANGDVVGWGRNNAGQTTVPPEASNVVALATANRHTLALREDGTVVAWGRTIYGPATVPVGLSNVVAVAAVEDGSIALRSDGTMWAWGTTPISWVNNWPSFNTNIVAISARARSQIALRADGKILTWRTPKIWLPADGDYVSAAGGATHSIGILATGKVEDSAESLNAPNDLTNALAVAAGWYTFFGLDHSGSIFAWGNTNYGATMVPSGLTNVVAVDGGYYSAYALGPDVPYIIDDGSFSGYVNRDILIRLPARDPNGDPLVFRIASPPTEGSLFQYNAGLRGDPITAPDAVVDDALGRVIFTPETNVIGSPYAVFDYLVNDGLADSAPAAITVNVVLPPAPQIDATSSGWSTNVAGAFELNFTGDANATYGAYASTNLLDWEWLGRAESLSGGAFQFLDLTSTNWPRRFYKVGAP